MRASEHGRRALAEARDLGRSITADTRDYGHLGPDYHYGTAQLFDIAQRDDGVWIYSVPAVLLEGSATPWPANAHRGRPGWHTHMPGL